jgi:hypothetical protein
MTQGTIPAGDPERASRAIGCTREDIPLRRILLSLRPRAKAGGSNLHRVMHWMEIAASLCSSQ